MLEKPAPSHYPINALIQKRWSPVAFANKTVSKDIVQSLFEGARWSPSAFNSQPWRFILGAKEGDPATFAKIFETLVPGNQAWAKNAPLLVLVVTELKFAHNGQENRAAFYDAGQAAAYLSIQATELGLGIHQLGGFDSDKAREVFGIPEGFAPIVVLAIGYEGDAEEIEDEKLRARHTNPVRARKPASEFVLTGASEIFGIPSPLL